MAKKKKRKAKKKPLSETRVLALRQKHETGRFSYQVLAEEYKISAAQVRNICLRFSWKNVP